MADRTTGSVLDAGWGEALYLAGRGCQVTTIGFLEERSTGRGGRQPRRSLVATFQMPDALALMDWIGADRQGIPPRLQRRPPPSQCRGAGDCFQGRRWAFLACFRDDEPGAGPERMSKEIRTPPSRVGVLSPSSRRPQKSGPTRRTCRSPRSRRTSRWSSPEVVKLLRSSASPRSGNR